MTEFAATLAERIVLESWLPARDAAGAEVGEWRPAGSAWASIVPDGGGGSEGEARRSRRRWRVTLRAPSPVQLTSRLRWRDRLLAVLAIGDDPRRPDRVVLRCEAREA